MFRTFGNTAVMNNSEAAHDPGGACCSACAAAQGGHGVGFVSTGEDAGGSDWSWLYLVAAGVIAARVVDWFFTAKPAPVRARRRPRRRRPN